MTITIVKMDRNASKPILCILQSMKNVAENIASTQAEDYQICS